MKLVFAGTGILMSFYIFIKSNFLPIQMQKENHLILYEPVS